MPGGRGISLPPDADAPIRPGEQGRPCPSDGAGTRRGVNRRACGIIGVPGAHWVAATSRRSTPMLDPHVQAQLAAILPLAALLTAPEDTKPYECDGLTLYRERPAAVVLPDTEAQVVRILALCHLARVPVVARGAGTSLSGGALPACQRRRAVAREVPPHPGDRHARRGRRVVQPGVRNLAISEAAAPYGLYYAPDPSSQIACTIGGNVAENAGGVHCLKYGLTVHNVRRVRGVLITGEVVEFGGDALDAPGYDLLALVNGSEGLLAVITEVTVKLLPEAAARAGRARGVRRCREGRRRRGGDHRRRHHPGRAGDDGPAGDARGRAVRARRATRSTPPRCCWSSPTARPRKSRTRWRRSAAC